jgi:hypothetical protein
MKKWAHELNRHFSEKKVQMANKYMKKCFPGHRRNANQSTNKISSQVDWPSSGIQTTNIGENVIKLEPLCAASGNVN